MPGIAVHEQVVQTAPGRFQQFGPECKRQMVGLLLQGHPRKGALMDRNSHLGPPCSVIGRSTRLFLLRSAANSAASGLGTPGHPFLPPGESFFCTVRALYEDLIDILRNFNIQVPSKKRAYGMSLHCRLRLRLVAQHCVDGIEQHKRRQRHQDEACTMVRCLATPERKFLGAQNTKLTQGSYIPVPRPNKREITPENRICRILMCMWSFGPLASQPRAEPETNISWARRHAPIPQEPKRGKAPNRAH